MKIWFADEARIGQKDHLSVGKAGHRVLGADRSTYGLDLYLWRYLPKRR